MSVRIGVRASACLAIVFLAAAAPPRVASAQAPAGVRGRVVDSRSAGPVRGMLVEVVGSRSATVTDGEGRYSLTNLPAGPLTLRFQWLGYRDRDVALELGEGEARVLDIALEAEPIPLGEVRVTTASRQPERVVESPAAVTTVSLLLFLVPIRFVKAELNLLFSAYAAFLALAVAWRVGGQSAGRHLGLLLAYIAACMALSVVPSGTLELWRQIAFGVCWMGAIVEGFKFWTAFPRPVRPSDVQGLLARARRKGWLPLADRVTARTTAVLVGTLWGKPPSRWPWDPSARSWNGSSRGWGPPWRRTWTRRLPSKAGGAGAHARPPVPGCFLSSRDRATARSPGAPPRR